MKVRFLIDVGNIPRTIVGVQETKSGDLNIHFTKGGKRYTCSNLKELISQNDEACYEDCNSHISVHQSPKSQQNTIIKQTHYYPKRLLNNEEVKYQFSLGLKQDNLFIPILFRIAGDLSRKRYQVPVGCKDIFVNIGRYSPQKEQLKFMLLISNVNSKFPQNYEHPSNCLEQTFSKFRLTLLWSYLNLPSHPQAIDFFLETTMKSGSIRGFDWNEIYNLYSDITISHANAYIKHLEISSS